MQRYAATPFLSEHCRSAADYSGFLTPQNCSLKSKLPFGNDPGTILSQDPAAFFSTKAKMTELFGVQNSCYVEPKGTADGQRRSRGKDGDQDGRCTDVADGIQTADPVKRTM